MAELFISRAGRDRLQKEMDHLKYVKRKEVSKALMEARAHGDLRENAEYDAAKQEQSVVEARISDLAEKLSRVRVLEDEDITGEHVSIGCRVFLKDLKTGEEEKYILVGEEESNIAEGRISIRTPIAKGLMGKVVGESVEIQIPAGTLKYEIVKIEVAV